MSESRTKRLHKANSWWRQQGPHYETKSTSNYGSAERSAKRKGYRHRTTEGMIYHLPSEDVMTPDAVKWPNKTVYLLYFGERLEDVQLAAAQFIMVHPNRTHRVLLSCKGERP